MKMKHPALGQDVPKFICDVLDCSANYETKTSLNRQMRDKHGYVQ